MASLSFDANGVRLLVVLGNRRPAIALGKIPRPRAETIKRHVESLATSYRHGLPIDSVTAAWVDKLDDTMHDRISATGLIEPRRRETLGNFLAEYMATRDIKASTATAQQQAVDRIQSFYGSDCPLESIQDGQAYITWLTDQKYSPSTVGRSTAWAKQFFRAAHRLGLIRKDPFATIRAKMQVNADRLVFIDRPTIAKLLAADMTDEWRLIIALARFGGLRTPSETLGLTWGDIQADRFWVTSPKTEHHPNGAGRWVPLFPELRPFIEAAQTLRNHGANVAQTLRNKSSSDYLIQDNREVTNWRTHMLRLLKRAGLPAWPRIFQNLRASRETELAAEYPLHVAASWIGNGSLVAARHYLTVREEDIARASAESCAASDGMERSASESARAKPKKTSISHRKRRELVGATGSEPTPDSTGNQAILSFTSAQSGAVQSWWLSLTVRQQAAIRAVACKRCA